MRHGVLELPSGSRFVPLRPEFVEACDGNACAALLLAIFDWRSAQAENFADTREEVSPWVSATMSWLSSWLGGGFGERALRTALDLLVEKGYVERRHNPDRELDRTLQYRLIVTTLHAQVSIPANAGMEADDRKDVARASEVVEELELQELPPSPVEEAIAYYREVVSNGSRYTIDRTDRKHVEEAITAGGMELVKRAILGLSRSPHHNGQNDRGKRYLHIAYAVRPKKHEAIVDRLEMMASYAQASSSPAQPASDPGGVVSRAKTTIGRYYSMGQPEGLRAQYDDAVRILQGLGFRYVFKGQERTPSIVAIDQSER